MAKRRARRKSTTGGSAKSPFLAILPRGVIKTLKLEAIERATTASRVLEMAILAWLRSGRSEAPPSSDAASSDKRQFLARLDAETLKKLKRRALERGRPVSALMAEAISHFIPDIGTPSDD